MACQCGHRLYSDRFNHFKLATATPRPGPARPAPAPAPLQPYCVVVVHLFLSRAPAPAGVCRKADAVTGRHPDGTDAEGRVGLAADAGGVVEGVSILGGTVPIRERSSQLLFCVAGLFAAFVVQNFLQECECASCLFPPSFSNLFAHPPFCFFSPCHYSIHTLATISGCSVDLGE